MRGRQRGMTVIGFLLVTVLVGAIGYGVLRVTPVYIEYLTLASVMDSVRRELEGEQPSPVSIRNALQRRLAVENVRSISAADFVIRQNPEGYVLALAYEGRTPYVANVSLVISFDRQVEIRR